MRAVSLLPLPPNPPCFLQRSSSIWKRQKQKAFSCFELAWNMVAIIFLVWMIDGSRFVPQHQQIAGQVRRKQ